eukprot:TRINITY_DN4877_c0_g2_i11.p1 TRINITY_DN4877_c0_g2~~TRINITY_DN4877_c0_g2_i11.p1  ORF type:complete len:680 (-),score=206.94 TRINITY_DN4877_c0_g2_i11:892-2931(-)
MLVAIKIEYENESISVALYEGIEVEELLTVITSSFHINGSIIGLRDPSGLIFLPKFICMNVPNIQQSSYELLVKGQKNSTSISKRLEPVQKPIVKEETKTVDNELVYALKYLRMDGYINRGEEKTLLDMSNRGNSELLRILNNYKASEDFQGFRESLKQLAAKKASQPQIHWQESVRPRTDAGCRSRRPLSAARLTENANINSTQAMLIGAVHDLEKNSLLDEQVVCTVKTLILEENPEVIKLLNSYIAHIIGERELCPRLQRLSDRMSTYIERPSSPLPRKSSLLEFVSSIVSTYIHDREDVELLQKLIEYENEFVLSAFDVFESDQDQENLLDTLLRILAKFKRMGITKDSVTTAGFYDGGILQPEIPRPTETRGRARRERQPFATETDSATPGDFPLHEGTSGQDDKSEEEVEEVNLPDAGLVYVTRGRKTKPKEEVKQKIERVDTAYNPTFKDFKELGALDALSDELIGTLKWGLMNDEAVLKGAYNTWKLTGEHKLFKATVETICKKLFEAALSEGLSSEQMEIYRGNRRNAKVRKMAESLRKTGNLAGFVEDIGGLADEMKRDVGEANVSLEDAKNEEEADQKELAADIFTMLENDGKISKVDGNLLNEMYKKGNKDVQDIIQRFKQDHEFTLLAGSLSKLVKTKQEKTKKKKKYKTFEECIKFFRVHLFPNM